LSNTDSFRMTSIFNKLLTALQIKWQGGAVNNGGEIDMPHDLHHTKAEEIIPVHPQWFFPFGFVPLLPPLCESSFHFTHHQLEAFKCFKCFVIFSGWPPLKPRCNSFSLYYPAMMFTFLLIGSDDLFVHAWLLPAESLTARVHFTPHGAKPSRCYLCCYTIMAKDGRVWKGNDRVWAEAETLRWELGDRVNKERWGEGCQRGGWD